MSNKETHGPFKEMIEATMVSHEERTVANTHVWVIEQMLPMEVFSKLPIKVQYLLITQNNEIEAFHEQMDNIREHLDRTPI